MTEAMQLLEPIATLAMKANNARALHSSGASLLLGAVGSNVVDHSIETTENQLLDRMWQLEQRTLTVIRTLMALSAQGYPQVLGELKTLVGRYGGVVNPTRNPSVPHLRELYGYFDYLRSGAMHLEATA